MFGITLRLDFFVIDFTSNLLRFFLRKILPAVTGNDQRFGVGASLGDYEAPTS
jgi:hypothetical protein